MARYIGPKTKIARKFGEPIYGPDNTLKGKITLPDNTGRLEDVEKFLNTAYQLKEKQKVKYTYGLLNASSTTCLRKQTL